MYMPEVLCERLGGNEIDLSVDEKILNRSY
jgi:hypothetical protein